MTSSLTDVPLRAASFTLEDRWLLWSRVRLYADRVELVGWSLTGRYHRVIPLEHIEEAKHADGDLVLRRAEGPPLRLQLEAPKRWATAIATHRDVRGGGTQA